MTDTLDRYTISITKEELSEMPRVEYNGVVRVVDTAAEMKKAVSILKKYDILGFDTESKPTFKKGATIHVSLIQIAAEDICFLFRIKKLKDIEPLRELMESEQILKIGLSIHDDFNIMSHDYHFTPKGLSICRNLFQNTSSPTQAYRKYMPFFLKNAFQKANSFPIGMRRSLPMPR